jgi:C4-dicarboxylate-specific signal transduction histidine kinase
VRQTRGTSLIEVKVAGEDPIEAAAIANEIADGYLGLRLQERREMRQIGIRLLQDELEKRSRAFTNKLAEVEALKASSGTNGSEARALEDLGWVREKISARIHQEEEESADSTASMGNVVDRAQPRLRPRHHQSALAIAAMLAGLGAIATGTSLLRKGKVLGLSTQSP